MGDDDAGPRGCGAGPPGWGSRRHGQLTDTCTELGYGCRRSAEFGADSLRQGTAWQPLRFVTIRLLLLVVAQLGTIWHTRTVLLLPPLPFP